MNIIYSHPNLEEFEKIGEADKSYIELLVADDYFKFMIQAARKRGNIPIDGYDLSKSIDSYSKDHPFSAITVKEVFNFSKSMVHHFNLPPFWNPTFSFLILFNFAYPPDKKGYNPIKIEKENGKISIAIYENLPLSKIAAILNSNEFKNALGDLPVNPDKKRFEINHKKREIYELRKDGKKDEEILENFSPDVDKQKINTWYHRFEKYLGQVTPKRSKEVYIAALEKTLHEDISNPTK